MSDPTEPAKPYRITPLYLAAVAFIYVCTSFAWLLLGAITENRTQDKDSELRNEIGQIWGGQHHQVPPQVVLTPLAPPPAAAAAGTSLAPDPNVAEEETAEANEKAPPPDPVPTACATTSTLEPTATDAVAEIDLEHRRKGLLWYATYGVRFDGTFTLRNDTPCLREGTLWVPFPSRGATYDDFSLHIDGEEAAFDVADDPFGTQAPHQGALVSVAMQPKTQIVVRVRYASRGLDSWTYSFGRDTARAKDFHLVVNTNTGGFDFPGNSLSPSSKEATDAGWALTWDFKNLLADASIAVAMPRKLNPGPLTTEISRFAPVSLFFFFFVLLLVSVIKQVRLHPVHFGLLAAAFFSFHLLTAYLVDHISIALAVAVSSVTSVGLVVSYLRLAVGAKFAVVWAGGAQLLYLVLFSLAFFVEGYTGLTITVFSVLTLFLVMQLTGRIDWSTKFGRPVPPTPYRGTQPHGVHHAPHAPFSGAVAAHAARPHGPIEHVMSRVD